MATLALDIVLFLAAFAFMEGFAWVMHRYVMHGFMWVWHKSHHEPREGLFELNDLFAVVFAARLKSVPARANQFRFDAFFCGGQTPVGHSLILSKVCNKSAKHLIYNIKGGRAA